MQKRLLFTLITLFIILLGAAIAYMLTQNPTQTETPAETQTMTEKMQQQYETYKAKIEAKQPKTFTLISDDDKELNDKELDHLYDKMFEAEEYLETHAPHLLPEPIDIDTSREKLFKLLKPESAAELKQELEQNRLEQEARNKALKDQLATWKQELIDFELEIEADEKRQAIERAKEEEKRAERERRNASLNAFIEKLKENLVFDDNGNPIGTKIPFGNASPVETDVSPEIDTQAEPPIDNQSFSFSEIKEFSEPRTREELENQTSFSFDSAKSFIDARKALDQLNMHETYFDVIMSQYMTPKELDTYFPTTADREMLKTRKAEMQKLVISEMRKVVSKLPDVSSVEKRSFIRKLVIDNFQKDFAESVLSEMEGNY